MLELKYRSRWQLAGFFLLLIAMIGSLLPEILIWNLPRSLQFTHSDKVLHFITFAFLAGWFSGQYADRTLLRIAVGLVAFGALIELIQGMVGYRVSDWMDLVADGIGIAIGLIAALLGLGGWSVRVERWLDN